MIKADSKPFSTVQKFRVVYEFDKTYNLEVEKFMQGATEYEAHIISYVDPDTSEIVPVLQSFMDFSEKDKAVFYAVEQAVENYCNKHGIGESAKPEER